MIYYHGTGIKLIEQMLMGSNTSTILSNKSAVNVRIRYTDETAFSGYLKDLYSKEFI